MSTCDCNARSPWGKWIIGSIIGPLLVAAILYAASHKEHALLLGYDAAITTGMAMEGKDIAQMRGRLDGYHGALGLGDLQYPSDPTIENGKAAQRYAETAIGRLASIDVRLARAFYLGWCGVIGLNTPSMRFENCVIYQLASEAGFPGMAEMSETEYLEWLVDKARRVRD